MTELKQVTFFLPVVTFFIALILISGCITNHPTCGNSLCEQFPNDENELDQNSTYYCPGDCGIIIQTHAECQQQKCIQVNGEGTNQCKVDSDCGLLEKKCLEQNGFLCRNRKSTRLNSSH